MLTYQRLCHSSLTIVLFLLSISAARASEYGFNWHAGAGFGTSTITGDYHRRIKATVVSMGMGYESRHALFIFDGRTATDNRFKAMRLLVGIGNPYFKIATGMDGIQSSYPTSPGIVAGFYTAATEQDTYVSATTIPLYLRITPYRSNFINFHLDGYIGLDTIGSIDIPVHTILLGAIGRVTTTSQHANGASGVSLSLTFKLTQHVSLRLYCADQRGRMRHGTERLVGADFGITKPVRTPDVQFENNVYLISLTVN